MKNILPNRKFNRKQLTVFSLAFGLIGTVAILSSFAATSSTISGTMWQDNNRNGVIDAGEAPFANKEIHIYDGSTGVYLNRAITDASGHYQFTDLTDGQYRVATDTPTWWDLRLTWTPTTGNDLRYSKNINLVSSGTVDIGLRQIVKSTDINAPLTRYTGPSGLTTQSYVDVVTAQDIYDALAKGSLIGGAESSLSVVDFGLYPGNITTASANQGSNGIYYDYRATSSVSYESWLDGGDTTLFHEYGHAWSQYYGLILQQDAAMVEYQKIRGVYGDARVNSTYEWQIREMIAEDYRQLFGTPNAASGAQMNTNIPLATAVPGLKTYLMGAFIHTDPSIPTAPRDLRGDGISTSQIKLDWSASVDNLAVTGYDIYRSDPSNPTAQKINSFSGSVLSYTDSNLSSAVAYSYYVTARDGAGNTSPASNIIIVNTLAPPPSAPSNLQATKVTDTSASLSWTASSGSSTTNYDVYRSDPSNPTAQKVGTVNSPSTTYVDTNLLPNTSYSYYVKARDATGTSSNPSNTITVKTLPPDTQAPTKPSNFKSTSITATSVAFSWTASTDNIGVVDYRIYKVGSSTALKTVTTTSGTVTGLAANTRYSFYVSAVDQAGNESPPSTSLEVRTARK